MVLLVGVALQPQEEELCGSPSPFPSPGLPLDPACLGFVPGLHPYLQTRLAAGVCLTPVATCFLLGALPSALGVPVEQVQAWPMGRQPYSGAAGATLPCLVAVLVAVVCVTAALITARRTHSNLGLHLMLPADFYINGILPFIPGVPLGFLDWGTETRLPLIVPLPATALG